MPSCSSCLQHRWGEPTAQVVLLSSLSLRRADTADMNVHTLKFAESACAEWYAQHGGHWSGRFLCLLALLSLFVSWEIPRNFSWMVYHNGTVAEVTIISHVISRATAASGQNDGNMTAVDATKDVTKVWYTIGEFACHWYTQGGPWVVNDAPFVTVRACLLCSKTTMTWMTTAWWQKFIVHLNTHKNRYKYKW